ncbi:PQ loop repeat-containing protein 3-like [Elysia marginata]|uniref:PQ loop repeat-containing protein 3-like n=1 Tax=Elysia marginata TaxID=1093978 RepID=A0AAV4EPL0_9GAST|nr:PQ loop repeat-containing protein 3-like [Elysia marginata]
MGLVDSLKMLGKLSFDTSMLLAPTTWSAEEQLWFFLNVTVFALTLVYKMPQVCNVVTNRSSVGISLPSLLLEFVSYSIEMTYQVAMAYPFETYFEICLMWAQDVILLYVVLEDRELIGRQLILPLLVFSLGFVSITNRWLPDIIMYSLILSTTPGLVVSKSAQLLKIIRSGDPGMVSSLTWGMLTYMAGVRVLTTFFVTMDIPMLLNNLSATILNATITVSVIYYNILKQRDN